MIIITIDALLGRCQTCQYDPEHPARYRVYCRAPVGEEVTLRQPGKSCRYHMPKVIA